MKVPLGVKGVRPEGAMVGLLGGWGGGLGWGGWLEEDRVGGERTWGKDLGEDGAL